MWTKKDTLLTATAALATFGITVSLLWPRSLNAGGSPTPVTSAIQQPKLELGNVSVTAALDPAVAHRVILTLVNSGSDPASANFKASAMVTGPASAFARGRPRPQQAWTQDYVLDLKPGETQQITVDLPDKVYELSRPPAPIKIAVNTSDNPDAKPIQVNRAIQETVPGNAYLALTPGPQGTNAIRAVTLWDGMALTQRPAGTPTP